MYSRYDVYEQVSNQIFLFTYINFGNVLKSFHLVLSIIIYFNLSWSLSIDMRRFASTTIIFFLMFSFLEMKNSNI